MGFWGHGHQLGIVLFIFLIATQLSFPNFRYGIPDVHDLIYHWSRIMRIAELLNKGIEQATMLPEFILTYVILRGY